MGRRARIFAGVAAVAAALVVAAGTSNAALINVNFNGFTGGNPGPTQEENTLAGPAGGLGTSWNQYAANSSSGTMVDSSGAPTTVTVATNFSEGRYDGTGPSLTMLRATLTDFSKGVASRTVTIGGLEANGRYDIWLVSHRHQAGVAERQRGTWTAANSTASATTQLVDGTAGTLNGATFVPGVNYALFQSVVASSAGQIVFNGKGATVADGFDADYRLHLSGLQIAPAAPVVPPEPLEIVGIELLPDTDEVSLTWKSNPGELYGLYWSPELGGFALHGVHHAVPAQAEENRTTLGPIPSPLPAAERLFFRMGPPDLSNPALSRAYGSGNTVTLVFSEPIHPDSAGDAGNFSVMLGDVPLNVLNVVLDSTGRNIVLTLGDALEAGAAYDVAAQHITTLAGRVIPAIFSGSFQTWDNDPEGVQVFILAGQSNMVGHGKAEDGHDNVPGAIGCLRHLAVNDGLYPDVDYRRLLVDPEQPATSAWRTRGDVKIWWRDSDLNAPRAVIKGDLGIGYSQSRNTTWYGPEYGFGWVVGDHFTDRPVLIVKVAWGGKDLHVDFRPPSAVAARGGQVGPYYTGMIDYVRDVLDNLGTEFPAFGGMGYRIAGFGWHQGWNDRVDVTRSAAYEANLVDLINDLRAEFGNPALPVSITTTGMAPPPDYTAVELAQLAVADPDKYPQFADNVRTADTRPFWRDASVSPSNFGYHWNHNGESQYLNGTAMGEKMVDLLAP